MISATWFADLEATIFTKIQYRMKNKYSSLYCTTKDESWITDKDAKFPALYLHETAQTEQGKDLVNNTVNAVFETIEIRTFSNKSAQECKQIMAYAITLMKGLRFDYQLVRDIQTINGVSTAIYNFSRFIGNGDSEIVEQ